MNKCSICLEEIINKSTTNCNHSFCFNCLNEWLSKNKNTCPICRRQLKNYINNGNNTMIISIPINNNNGNLNDIDFGLIHSQLIRDTLLRKLYFDYKKLKNFLYFISCGFLYTFVLYLKTRNDNSHLIEELNLCELNLTKLEKQIYFL